MNPDRIVVNKGVVRYIATGLIPELYELEEMLVAKRITRRELDLSSQTRMWEMVEA
jgi:hypothetical protein